MPKTGALFSTSNRKHTLAGICRKTTRFITPYTSSVLPSWGYSLLSSPCLSLHWEVHSGSTSGAQAAQGAAKRLYIHMHSCRQSRVLATKRHRIFSQTHVQKFHIVPSFLLQVCSRFHFSVRDSVRRTSTAVTGSGHACVSAVVEIGTPNASIDTHLYCPHAIAQCAAH